MYKTPVKCAIAVHQDTLSLMVVCWMNTFVPVIDEGMDKKIYPCEIMTCKYSYVPYVHGSLAKPPLTFGPGCVVEWQYRMRLLIHAMLLDELCQHNSSSPSAAYMRQWIEAA